MCKINKNPKDIKTYLQIICCTKSKFKDLMRYLAIFKSNMK